MDCQFQAQNHKMMDSFQAKSVQMPAIPKGLPYQKRRDKKGLDQPVNRHKIYKQICKHQSSST